MRLAPRARSCDTIVASKGELWEARNGEAHVVDWRGERVVILSFTARVKDPGGGGGGGGGGGSLLGESGCVTVRWDCG